MSSNCYNIINVCAATFDQEIGYGLIDDAAIVVKDDRIEWIGAMDEMPQQYHLAKTVEFPGCIATPALIDCHTHLVHGGHRADEFAMRLSGATYAEIQQAGGGILSTVNATRDTSEACLIEQALPRVDALLSEGVTTIEVKSGYGLNRAVELKMLRVARKLATLRPVNIVTSYLAAHAVAPEYKGRADDYIDEICLPTLYVAHAEGLVDMVDGFCERIAFNADQIERVFRCASDLGIPVKLHAEQLSDQGGARLAANYGALSVDHLEYLNEADIKSLAVSGTVAVMLPGAFYTLKETQKPPIDLLRQYQVPMAVATDYNPGSSPLNSLLLAMNMASTLFDMTPEESLAGATKYAARALGLNDRGMLKAGYQADIAIWNIDTPAELVYRIGFNPLNTLFIGGRQWRR